MNERTLTFKNGVLKLPVYLPDATYGVVRSVDAQDLEGCGVEALVRWEHPHMGAVAPEMILAIAARAEFAERLGRHIIKLVLAKVQTWPHALKHLRVSINVSAPAGSSVKRRRFSLS